MYDAISAGSNSLIKSSNKATSYYQNFVLLTKLWIKPIQYDLLNIAQNYLKGYFLDLYTSFGPQLNFSKAKEKYIWIISRILVDYLCTQKVFYTTKGKVPHFEVSTSKSLSPKKHYFIVDVPLINYSH